MFFLYIPNIIDYFRFLCLIVCLFTWTSSPLYTVFFYLLNMILDEFDGRAARKFNQTSTFGAVLDMVCDRSTDAVMTSFLSHLYPQYNGFFYGIMILDISSHWLLMYATALEANSHKSIKTQWRLLQLYYSSTPFLNLLVYGCEIFYSALYLFAFKDQIKMTYSASLVLQVIIGVSFVTFVLKQMTNVLQLIYGSQKLVYYDLQKQKTVS